MRKGIAVVLTACLTLAAAIAWGYWTTGSTAGGNGAAAATSVNQGATPTASAVGSTVTVATVIAEPSGQFWPSTNCCWTRLPIMNVLDPPSSWALTKSPRAGRKTSSMPPYSPGALWH